ncbi:hypothetical protein [Streptomyces sp. URMC 129]|uniref:hypothetical protein n=1 Tax=Streptomyces sp. URMC 129 TaxID=3423407 RepID=UPI003F1ACA4E
MRTSIRIALPAVAAAALLLSGCGDDDSDGGNGPVPGADGGQEQGGAESGGEEATGGSDGGESGAEGASGGDSGGQGGSAPTAEQLEGMWLEGTNPEDSSLMFSSGSVTYIEDDLEEGDLCSGTVNDTGFTVECTQLGAEMWPDTEATMTLDGETLTVVWASGTTETFTSFGDVDLGDMGDLEDLEQELEDLGY